MKQMIILSTLLFAFAACSSSKKNTFNMQPPKPDASLTETYWKLIEVMGNPVSPTEANQREAHMILKNEASKVNGNGGCNTFNGTYELKAPGRISFSKVATTQMACVNMVNEAALYKALETADSYYIKGDTLQLIRARMAPLAKFQAVYLK